MSEGNYFRGKFYSDGEIFPWGNFFLRGNYPRGKLSGGQLFGGGNHPWGKLSGGQFSTRANVLEPADREKILREINSLDHTKVCQEYDISTKVIKEDAEIVSEILHLSFNVSVNQGTFPSVFKITG